MYLRRSSCFIRLCFSRCSPSVTLYISLRTDTKTYLLLGFFDKTTPLQSLILACPHLFLLLKPGRLILQHAQLVLGQRQLLAGGLQRAGQLVVGHLQFDVLHVALLLLAVQLVALELQLHETVEGVNWCCSSVYRSGTADHIQKGFSLRLRGTFNQFWTG